MATGYATLGDYPKATQMFYSSLRISESLHDVFSMVRIYNNLGDTYIRRGDYRKALDNLLPAIANGMNSFTRISRQAHLKSDWGLSYC